MTNRSSRTAILAGWAAGLLLGASGLAFAAAGPEETTRNRKLGQGAALYRINCQNCHGRSAEGDGTIAELLTVEPTNLTVLARDNDGEFPTEEIRRIIDGRDEIAAHGRREMPVWGDVFLPTGEGGTDETGTSPSPEEREKAEAEVREKIDCLVLYLKSIQE